MGILDIFGVGPVAELAGDILKMFPNAEQRATAANKLQDFAAQIAAAQSATNTAEAATGSLFIAGWRPFVGWSCGIGFVYGVMVQPILAGICSLFSLTGPPPVDIAVIASMLSGLLGLGTMRTVEKVGGVATTAIKALVGRK